MATFAGSWLTTFGRMELTEDHSHVQGSYLTPGGLAEIEGQITGQRLTFHYREPGEAGEGWFDLHPLGDTFRGEYTSQKGGPARAWEGERLGFSGLWNTTFGPMRLIETEGRVEGSYALGGGATLTGRRKGDQLSFRFREVEAQGSGTFVLAPDGLGFEGTWRQKGEDIDRPWQGLRIRPRPGRWWLVVLEAPWQRTLSDPEYAFGHMLGEFFARLEHVSVRHRFFTNEAGLTQALGEVAFLAEPVVVVIATHAEEQGLRVQGRHIDVGPVLKVLQVAASVRALHFSACLLLKDPTMVARLQEFSDWTGVAVSGYRTSVNWAASAILEFTYLEMILNQRFSPEVAATQVAQLLTFSGDRGEEGSAFAPADFRQILPNKGDPQPGKPRRKARNDAS